MTPEQIIKAEQIKLRDEWRDLNLRIAQHEKVISKNGAAGQVFDPEYLDWVQQLRDRRNELTNII